MKLSKFVQRDKSSPIHSSGFVQSGERIGSTSVNPFSQRLERDRSRQLIGGYRDASVLSQPRIDNRDGFTVSRRDTVQSTDTASGLSAKDRFRGSRIDVVRPPGGGSLRTAPPPPPAHSFREPPSRHRP